jgi:hypothetical protein
MPRYRIITLIDITRTNASKSDPDDIKKYQQSNFNTLRQSIELRSNVSWTKDPEKKSGALPYPFDGKANYWVWEFECEREDVFLRDDDPVGLLKDDLYGVPIITDLENSVEIHPAAIQTKNGSVNTIVEII